jgi:DNA invertase Pin-like site-specific DNA recombinase
MIRAIRQSRLVRDLRQRGGGDLPADRALKDSDKRQLASVTAYAKANGFDIVATFYDAAVSGADPVTDRPGFAEMLTSLALASERTSGAQRCNRKTARHRDVTPRWAAVHLK